MIQNSFYKSVNKGVGRFPMRESFFAQGRAYAELRRIEQLCETGNFDVIPTAPTSNSQLSIAVANGILPRARQNSMPKIKFILSTFTDG